MYAGQHAESGLTISGSISVDPPLNPDEAELLAAVEMAGVRAALQEVPSGLVDTLAPGHPEGPNPWAACEDGCCLELAEDGLVQIDAIEPWLAYLVGDLLVDHAFSGAIMLWDHAERVFSALTIAGTKVRRRRVLEDSSRRSRRTQQPRGERRLRGV